MGTITVESRAELEKTKRPGQRKFAIEDTNGVAYICFAKEQYDKFEPGAVVEVVITPSQFDGGMPMIKLYKEEEPNRAKGSKDESKKRQPTTAPYRGRDEDKVSLRTAIMEVGEDVRSGKRPINDPLAVMREVWLYNILQVTQEKALPEVEPARIVSEDGKIGVATGANTPSVQPKLGDKFTVWLAENMPKANWKPQNALAWVNRNGAKLKADTLESLVSQLTEEMKKDLKEEIERRIK